MFLIDETSSDQQVFLQSNLPASRLQPDRDVPAVGDIGSKEETANMLTFQDVVESTITPSSASVLLFSKLAIKKSLASLRQDSDSNDIVIARRVAKRKIGLGGKCDKMVKMCLRGTPASLTDLNEAELQRAAYNKVACPLEELIEKLSALTS
jgi:hypothetical protein